MNHATVRSLLLAVLVVGAVGSIGPGTTYSLFTNTHDGTGTVTAADNVNGNSNSAGVTADTGGTYTVIENGSVELDASESTTSNGNIVRYQWNISGPNGDSQLSGQEVLYEAPASVSSDETVDVELTVETNQQDSDTNTTTVTINDADGCGATELRFCEPSVADRETAYAASYEVDDPNGEYKRVEVTLVEVQNQNQQTVLDTAPTTATSGTLSVSGGNNMNQDYAVKLELYNKTEAVSDCRITGIDSADGIDPTLSEC